MLKRLYTKFMSLSPFLKVVSTLLGIFGVIGSGYVIKGNSFFQTVINNNYNYTKEEATNKPTLENNNPNNVSEKQTKISNQAKAQPSTNTTISKPKKVQAIGLFSESQLKKTSQTNISFFVTKNGSIDSRVIRAISSNAKQLNLNVPILFNRNFMSYFDDFMFPSDAFLNKHNTSNYLDYYFICDITPLDTKKTSGMDTYTSALNIEGYLINVMNNSTIKFPYKNIKGAGFSTNDADLNAVSDLENKIILFIKSNLKA